MGWRERLEPASFKGVPFFVEASGAAKGRRVPVRRLAGQDGSRQQDLGRNPDQFDVEAFLAGEDFDVERDELEAALLTPGAGALVLPSRGELWARVISGPSVNEARSALGFCTIRFTVVLEDKARPRSRQVSTASALARDASLLKTAATTDFTDVFSVLDMPAKYISSVTTAVSSVTQTLRKVQGKIAGVLNPLEDIAAAISELDATITTLMNTPSALANKLLDIVDKLFGLADTTADSIDRTTGLSTLSDEPFARSLSGRTTALAAKGLHGLGASQVGATNTTLGSRNAANLRAVYRLVRTAAVARQFETYARAPIDASTLALAIITDAVEEVDALQAYSATDALVASLADGRKSLVSHLNLTATALPSAVTYTPRQEVPALLLAHALYGDARLESDIVARNRPKYPLFLGGKGRTVEVLEP